MKRNGAVVAQQPHKLKVTSSNLVSATVWSLQFGRIAWYKPKTDSRCPLDPCEDQG